MNIGILGTGFGKYHAGIYKSIPGVKIAGIAGRSKEKTEKAAEELGVRAFLDMNELISLVEVEIIDVCLPTPLHKKYVVAALESGKDVFCETPLAYSLSDAWAMIKAAKKNKKRVFVAFFNRFISEYVYAHNLINSSRLGVVRTLHCNRRTPPVWGNLAKNIILDFMIHDIDYTCWLLGKPDEVVSQGVECKTGGWDSVFISMIYKDKIAVIEGCGIMPLSAPFQTGVRLVCHQGALDIDWAMKEGTPASAITLYPEQGNTESIPIEVEDPYRAECLHVLQCLRQKKPSSIIDITQAQLSLSVALAAQKSLATGQRVAL
jgi:UDP-N-acetylglucosamine 3-dehydrogenase